MVSVIAVEYCSNNSGLAFQKRAKKLSLVLFVPANNFSSSDRCILSAAIVIIGLRYFTINAASGSSFVKRLRIAFSSCSTSPLLFLISSFKSCFWYFFNAYFLEYFFSGSDFSGWCFLISSCLSSALLCFGKSTKNFLYSSLVAIKEFQKSVFGYWIP